MHLPCSQTPVGHSRQTITALMCCPRDFEDEGSNNHIHYEAQSHGFCNRCLRFVPTLLTTTQDSLSGWWSTFTGGARTHWVSMKCFSACALGASPLPGLNLAPQN